MTDTETTIQLDRKHKAIRSGDRWALLGLRPNGEYDLIEAWDGPRRSIFQRLADHDIHPSRQAEAQLATLPERRAFPPDNDRAT